MGSTTRLNVLHSQYYLYKLSKNMIAIARVWRITEAFARGQTVVGSRNAVVDLFPRILSNIINEHSAGGALKRKRERVTQAKCPDRAVVAGRIVEERIVGWNRAG